MLEMFQIPLKQHIEEEAKLLADEKWIIEALKITKKQRNSLQLQAVEAKFDGKQAINIVPLIERLHLESVKARIKSNALETNEIIHKEQECATGGGVNNEMEEDLCNGEELNLTVTNSVFGSNENVQLNNEEEEDNDEEEGNEEEEDLEIDMDLFMITNNEQSQSLCL